MKCHYEVLEVPRDASQDEIKIAYRKLALKWHPDKNLNNAEAAKEQFQLIQQAFQILSDPQERAWYDKYREQILRGPSSEFKDDGIDIIEYFSNTCYKGFGDDENGFYAVYSGVFDEIVKDEMKFIDDKNEFLEIPKFGHSQSDYENVKKFYDYWSCFQTKKSFAWLNTYDINEPFPSKILKLIDRENKKVRLKAKKEWNERVRELVAIVRKRDKRMQKFAKIQQDKILQNRQRQEELRKQKKLDRIQQLKESEEPEWAKFDKVQSELEDIESHLNEQFGDDDKEEEDEYIDNLYCPACNKLFKTPKSFQNHESSKKHKEAVEKLRQELLDEEEEGDQEILEDDADLDISSEHSSYEEIENKVPNDNILENSNDESTNDFCIIDKNDEDLIESDNSEIDNKKKSKKKKKKKVLKVEDNHEIGEKLHTEQDLEANANNWSEDEKPKKSKKQSKKSKKAQKETNVSLDETNVEQEEVKTNEMERSKNKKSKSKKNKDEEDAPKAIVCLTCHSSFQSKNKLYEHLKATGHGVPLSSKKKK